MLTFLNPGYALAGLLGAVATVALHFIVRRRPHSMLFATARFVPQGRVVTTSWDRRPSDLLLAALRAGAVLLAGVALAGPVLRDERRPVVRMILADRSRAVADAREVSDSVAAVFRAGDVIVNFDSAATIAPAGLADTQPVSTGRRGSISVALITAVRAASAVRDRADSIELVLVSPLSAEEMDNATLRVRDEWPGRARIVPVRAASQPLARGLPFVDGSAAHPLTVAVSPSFSGASSSRIVTGDLTVRDSAWSREAGHVLVHWPARGGGVPAGFAPRPARDTVFALVTRGASVMAPFERTLRPAATPVGTVAAAWADGEPAAMEWREGAGCVRSVAIPVASAGDLVLRDDFRSVVADLSAPCGGAYNFARAPSDVVQRIARGGALAQAGSFAPGGRQENPARPWLLATALLFLLAEMLLRRRKSIAEPAGAAESVEGEAEAKVA